MIPDPERFSPTQWGKAAPDAGSLVPLPPLDEAGRAVLRHAGHDYAVFTAPSGEVVVLDGVCPHKGGPLAEGLVRGGSVVCPWHWYAFDLVTGACTNAEMNPARRLEVVDEDGVLHARILPRPAPSWAERLRAHARGED